MPPESTEAPAPAAPATPARLAPRRVSDRWSRTTVTGIVALGGLTILGVVGLLTGRLDGAGLAGLASIFGGIVTAVAGRPTAPGKDS